MRMVKKGDLPEKPCACCGRPFTWRKKWARDWENVKYCSDRCRQSGTQATPAPALNTAQALASSRRGGKA